MISTKSLILCFFILFLSCSKEELSERIVGRWEVVNVQVDSNSEVLKAPESYYFNFKTDGYALFETDTNSCGITYTAGDDGAFGHDFPLCTLVGGDSEFSESIIASFASKKIAYSISGKKLTILGNGFIKFKKARYE